MIGPSDHNVFVTEFRLRCLNEVAINESGLNVSINACFL